MDHCTWIKQMHILYESKKFPYSDMEVNVDEILYRGIHDCAPQHKYEFECIWIRAYPPMLKRQFEFGQLSYDNHRVVNAL